MRLLLNTHAFLFAISSPELLTAKGRRVLTNPDVERWVSPVSLWEIAIKVHIGKLAMPLEGSFFAQHLRTLSAQTLAVDLRHSLALLWFATAPQGPFRPPVDRSSAGRRADSDDARRDVQRL